MSYFFHKSEQADRIHTMTDSIIIQMLNARIAEKNFMLRDLQNERFYQAGFSNNLQDHQLFIKNAQEKIGYLVAWQSDNAKNEADLLLQLVDEYNNIFNELLDTYQRIGFKDWGLLGQWRQAIHEIESQITRMNRTEMHESLLQLRRLEKDYLLRGDEKYLEDIRNQISALRKEILKIPSRQAIKISEELTAYENAFHQFILLQRKIGRTEEEGLQRQFNEVVERMETVFNNIMTESKSEYERARLDFRLTSLIIYLLGVAMGSTVYYFFARSISLKLIALKNGVLRRVNWIQRSRL
jgi:methyl-accepting chemotaxis protein